MKSKNYYVLGFIIIALITLFIVKYKDWSSVFESILQMISFLAIAYLLFFESFVKEVGKETAELMAIKEKTQIKEQVKLGFSKAIEEYKADLAIKNIAYQVDYSFYYTARSKALIDLYNKLAKVYNSGTGLSALFSLSLEKRKLEESKAFEEVHVKRIGAYSDAFSEVSYAIDFNMFFLEKDIIKQLRDFIIDVDNFCHKYIRIDASYIKTEEDIENEKKAIKDLSPRLQEFAELLTKLIQPNDE